MGAVGLAHCKKQDLEDIEYLLNKIRSLNTLNEKTYGCFYLKSKSLIHFHIKDKRRYAHLWSNKNWVELDIPYNMNQKNQNKVFSEINRLVFRLRAFEGGSH